MRVQEFYDSATNTLSYIVYDEHSRDALLIDPVLDFDPASGKIGDTSAQRVVAFLRNQELNLHFILETHAHADHLSGAQVIKKSFPQAQLAIGARIVEVQELFSRTYNFPKTFPTDGSQFDRLLKDNEEFSAGSIKIKVIFTPGHTPACVSFIIGNNIFTGDALFLPDSGTGRCDFPGGSAEALYKSIQRIYALPETTRIYVGHDYQPGGRELCFVSTVGEEKAANIHIKANTSQEEFISFRQGRDKTLSAPRLLLPSLQINISAGHLPEPESNGKRFLKIPLELALSNV